MKCLRAKLGEGFLVGEGLKALGFSAAIVKECSNTCKGPACANPKSEATLSTHMLGIAGVLQEPNILNFFVSIVTSQPEPYKAILLY